MQFSKSRLAELFTEGYGIKMQLLELLNSLQTQCAILFTLNKVFTKRKAKDVRDIFMMLIL